jgi:hypothetical protein
MINTLLEGASLILILTPASEVLSMATVTVAVTLYGCSILCP